MVLSQNNPDKSIIKMFQTLMCHYIAFSKLGQVLNSFPEIKTPASVVVCFVSVYPYSIQEFVLLHAKLTSTGVNTTHKQITKKRVLVSPFCSSPL